MITPLSADQASHPISLYCSFNNFNIGVIHDLRINTVRTRCDQKVLDPICFSEILGIKIFVSRSFDIIEGHW